MRRASLACLLAEERSILAKLAAVRHEIEAREGPRRSASLRLVPALEESRAVFDRTAAYETRSEFLEVTR
jgi:hypothetical protein